MLKYYRFMFPRERELVNICMIGNMKTGKTTMVLELIDIMMKQQNRPVLLLDTGRQAEYSHIKKIEVEDLKMWGMDKQGFRTKNPIVKIHIEIDPDKGRTKQTKDFDRACVFINQYVWNSFIVFEDALAYISLNPPASFKSMLRNTRNQGNDFLCNMHSLSDTPAVIYDNSQVFLIKHCVESEFPKKARNIPLPEIFNALAKMNRHFVNLPSNTRKIHYATVEYIADPAIREQFNDPDIVSNFPASVRDVPIDSFR